MRSPEADLSDQRRSHTSGPRLRFFLIKLQFCIAILLHRSSGAGKMFTDRDRRWHTFKGEPQSWVRTQENTALRRQQWNGLWRLQSSNTSGGPRQIRTIAAVRVERYAGRLSSKSYRRLGCSVRSVERSSLHY